MISPCRRALHVCVAILVISSTSTAQQLPAHVPPDQSVHQVVKNLLQDQKAIWTSPKNLKRKDLLWIVPASIIIAEGIHRDPYMYSRLKFHGDGKTSASFSNVGALGLGGFTGALYIASRLTHNDHGREAGALATEALADSLAVQTALKYALRRERPFAGNGQGDFFTSGGDSFPSLHATGAWSLATVLAHEYPGPLSQVAFYGLASAVSVARVTGRQHFPTDVLVGSALGYGIGRYVYHQHHDPMLPGENIGTFVKDDSEPPSASPYVPLEDWAYSAMERLSALGYCRSSMFGMRPWTRSEFARLLLEAHEQLQSPEGAPLFEEAQKLVDALDKRFGTQTTDAFSNAELSFRVLGIAGTPVVDAFHFGQTISNDYGRPYGEGINTVAGISDNWEYGRWGAYVHYEFESAAPTPNVPFDARFRVATVDQLPLIPEFPQIAARRGRLLDAYLSFAVAGWQLSAGKQSLWWGPGESGALNLSNNAQPINMLRISRPHPIEMPSFLSFLGALKLELFLGQLGGQTFVRTSTGTFGPDLSRQPLIHGEKFTFHVTENLDFGFSESTIFGGPGFPLTARTFLRSYSIGNSVPGAKNDPGDRRSGFDFRYRIPGLRNWLTLYNDSFTEDEFSPIAYPRRSAMQPGVYLARVPGLNHADLRLEGFYTDLPGLRLIGEHYFNTRYLSGFTNNGGLLGHPVGRQGLGYKAQSRWWKSPDQTFDIFYEKRKASPEYLPGGASMDDAGGTWRLTRGNTEWNLFVQAEHWTIPVLAPAPQWNVSTALEFKLKPCALLKKKP